MARFRYVAASSTGGIRRGNLEAADKAEAVRTLGADGLMVMELVIQAEPRPVPRVEIPQTRIRPSRPAFPPAPPRGRWSRFQRACFLRQLALMTSAGVPIHAGLETLARQAVDTGLQGSLDWLAGAVCQGQRLSRAMQQAGLFEPLHGGTVRVGEESGTLDDLLHMLAELEEKEVAVSRRLVSQLSYPAAVLVTMTLALVLLGNLMGGTLTSLAASLGQGSGLLALAGALFGSRWMLLLLLLCAAGLMAAAVSAWRSERGRRVLEPWLVRVPKLGALLTRIQAARLCRLLGVMACAGVRADQALELAANSTPSPMASAALKRARALLLNGESFSCALKGADYFPVEVVSMAAAGEQSGRLSDMLATVAEYADSDVDRTIDAATTLIEPILVTGLGVVIAVVALLTFAPLYQAIQTL